MFAGYQIDAITNGVHVATWASKPFQELYDRYIPDWRQDNFSLRYAESIPKDEVWAAHTIAKADLLRSVETETKIELDPDVLTIGLARRFTAYKRPDLIFSNTERLEKLCHETGPLQIVLAGKAHPSDHEGKLLIQRICRIAESLKGKVTIAYLVNYDMDLAKLLTSGVDLWLNTPQPPLEASGTSGMKAAVNGVPSLSVLDGWWIEGLIEGVTGWSNRGGPTGPIGHQPISAPCQLSVSETGDQGDPRFLSRWQPLYRSNAPRHRNQRIFFQYAENAPSICVESLLSVICV